MRISRPGKGVAPLLLAASAVGALLVTAPRRLVRPQDRGGRAIKTRGYLLPAAEG